MTEDQPGLLPDAARLAAERGIDHLRRYEETEDPAELAHAIRWLTGAVDADRYCLEPYWRYLAGIALGYRADLNGPAAIADADQALDLLTEVLCTTGDDELAAEILTDLVDLLWSLCRLVADLRGEPRASEWLFGWLDRLPVRRDGGVGEFLPRVLAGLAWIGRYWQSKHEPDLLTGIDLLTVSLPNLPEDLSWTAEGWLQLSIGCSQAWYGDQSRSWTDRAVQAAVCARRSGGAGVGLDSQEATARYYRWERDEHESREDLDRAIECFERVLATAEAEADDYYCYGDLLCQRAELDRSRLDAAAAVRALESAVTSGVVDAELELLYRFAFAEAHRVLGVLDPDPTLLAPKVGAWAAVAGPDLPDALARSLALSNWLASAHDWYEALGLPPGQHTTAGQAVRAALAAADAAVDAVVAADPESGALLAAMLLIVKLWWFGTKLGRLDVPRVHQLMGWLDSLPGELAPTVRDLATGLIAGLEDTLGAPTGDYGVPALTRALNRPGLDQDTRRYVSMILGALTATRGSQSGDRSSLVEGNELIERARKGESSAEALDTDLLLAASQLSFVLSTTDSSEHERASVIDKALVAAERSVGAGRESSQLVRLVVDAARLAGVQVPPALQAVPASPQQPGGYGETLEPANESLRLAADYAEAERTGDLLGRQRSVDQLAVIAEGLEPGHPLRPLPLLMLATTTLDLARVGSAVQRQVAVRWNEQAVGSLPGPQHPLWAQTCFNLAESVRLVGELDRSRQIGFDAMRGEVWQALLQAGTDEALQAARGAADLAGTLASWCLADGAHEDLVLALETGRGLVLHAATSDRQVGEQLRALGEPALALEWQAAAASPMTPIAGLVEFEMTGMPNDLRHRVLRVLLDAGAAVTFEPPTVAQLGAAVATGQFTAIGYLVPRSDGRTGAAVFVASDGSVEVIRLPDLRTDDDSPLPAYQVAYAAAAEADANAAADQVWRAQLNEVCDWAWQVAGRQLLEHCESRWPGQSPRLALVPLGALALVPWHAARRPVPGGGYRYLVQDAALSVLPSGRLLCDLVRRAPTSLPAVTILANPTGDLEFASSEAAAIHASFYPDARYLGLLREQHGDWCPAPDGAGQPEQLLELIEAGAASSILHLACHAVADQQLPSRSHLMLAQGRPLPVRQLLARRRSEWLRLDRVILSGCTTHLAGEAYDEAVSLASAFLAAGARTVIGSLWQVPDGSTSVLMYLTHHFLSGGRPPIEALRLAQCWMLDPMRQLPAGLPGTLLGPVLTVDLAEPAAWAGFVHLGR